MESPAHFSFSTSPDQPKADTGGGAVSDATRSAASANADSAIAERPRRRYTKRSAGDSALNKSSLQASIDAKIQEQLEAVHDEKAWGALLGLPATVARVITKNDRWKLDGEERETLGATGSAFSRTMMVTNPRTLAALMLVSALTTVYVPRAVIQLEEWLERKRGKEKDKAEAEKK